MSQQVTPRPWYKKKRYVIGLPLLGLFVFASLGNATPTSVQKYNFDTEPNRFSREIHTPSSDSQVPVQTSPNESNLSNNSYYTNTYGNEVHSPAYSDTVPVGGSAQRRNGKYRFR